MNSAFCILKKRLYVVVTASASVSLPHVLTPAVAVLALAAILAHALTPCALATAGLGIIPHRECGIAPAPTRASLGFCPLKDFPGGGRLVLVAIQSVAHDFVDPTQFLVTSKPHA